MERFFEWLISPKAILSIIVIAVAVIVCIAVKKISVKYKKVSSANSQKITLAGLLFRFFNVLISVSAVLIVLNLNGINVTSMVAGLGIFSAVIGLALQDYLKDVIMGIHIVSDHFFAVGECVEYQGRECKVIEFSMKATKLGDLDDHSIYTVCNRNISEIRRLSKRLDIDIPISYKEDAKKVKSAFESLSEKIAHLDGVEKCEYKGTQSFEASAILYRLRIFCGPENRPDVRRDALGTIYNALTSCGIKIPYSQLDVHLNTEK